MEDKEEKEDILGSILKNPVEESSTELEIMPNKIADDYEYVKENIRQAIEKGNVALEMLLSIAQESGHPRAFTAFTELLAVVVTANKDLMESKEINAKVEASNDPRPNTVNNTLVLTTSDLASLIEKSKRDPNT